MQCSAVQYSTVPYSIVHTLQYSEIKKQCSTVHDTTLHYSAVQENTIHYIKVQCSAVLSLRQAAWGDWPEAGPTGQEWDWSAVVVACAMYSAGTALPCSAVHYVFRSIVALHSFRLKLCCVKHIVQCSVGQCNVVQCSVGQCNVVQGDIAQGIFFV